jgi:hypothetical protein
MEAHSGPAWVRLKSRGPVARKAAGTRSRSLAELYRKVMAAGLLASKYDTRRLYCERESLCFRANTSYLRARHFAPFRHLPWIGLLAVVGRPI